VLRHAVGEDLVDELVAGCPTYDAGAVTVSVPFIPAAANTPVEATPQNETGTFGAPFVVLVRPG
jgi:hypothetical protein